MSSRESGPDLRGKPSDSLLRLPTFVVRTNASASAKVDTLKHVRPEDVIQYRNALRRGLGIDLFTNKIIGEGYHTDQMNGALEKIYSTSERLLTTYKSYEGLGEPYSLIIQRFKGILGATLDSTDPRSVNVGVGLDFLTETEGKIAAEICSGVGFGDQDRTAEVAGELVKHLTGSMREEDNVHPRGEEGKIVTDKFLNALFTFPLEDFTS